MTVLIVDDDDLVRRGLTALLQREVHVVAVGDIDRALQALAQEQFKAALCDLDLRDRRARDGLWLLDRMRRDWPSTRRALITGSPPADLDRHVAGGLIDMVLVKPMDSVELIEAVRMLMRG